MKIKTIKKVLEKIHNEWIGSIKDNFVAELAEKNTIITGGSITSMLLKEPVNDYDLYFRDLETTKAVIQYYLDQYNLTEDSIKNRILVEITSDNQISMAIPTNQMSVPIEEDDRIEPQEEKETTEDPLETLKNKMEKFRPVFFSPNAITLSDNVQLMSRFYGEPDQIHENYDFVHCTNYWDSKDKTLVLRPKALESILTRELIYVGSLYPVCSLIRMRKFIKRNWSVNAGQILKIVMQINELDLTDIAVLKDQLIGVDTAYFITLIEELQAKDPEKVNTAYLMEIIDRIF